MQERIREDVATLDAVREHLAGRHEEHRGDCMACQLVRLGDAFDHEVARLTGERDDELQTVEALTGNVGPAGWRDYSVETDGADIYRVCVVCRSDGACEWTEPNADGRYLTLGEAIAAARAHIEWHAINDQLDPAAPPIETVLHALGDILPIGHEGDCEP